MIDRYADPSIRPPRVEHPHLLEEDLVDAGTAAGCEIKIAEKQGELPVLWVRYPGAQTFTRIGAI